MFRGCLEGIYGVLGGYLGGAQGVLRWCLGENLGCYLKVRELQNAIKYTLGSWGRPVAKMSH